MGHEVSLSRGTWGNVHAVDWNLRTGVLRGGSDPRSAEGAARVVVTPVLKPEAEAKP